LADGAAAQCATATRNAQRATRKRGTEETIVASSSANNAQCRWQTAFSRFGLPGPAKQNSTCPEEARKVLRTVA
jgi:hypothetical protein